MNARTLAELRGVTALLFGSALGACARGAELDSEGNGGDSLAAPDMDRPTTSTSTTNGSFGTSTGARADGGAGGAPETASSSSSTSSASSTAGSTASTGGTSLCDGTSSCQTCATCSIEDDCSATYATCLASAQCNFYTTCRSGCLTDACVQGCQTLYPSGASLHEALATCVCAACANDCAGSTWGC